MPIRWDKLTVKAQEAMQRANDLASEHGNPELQPVHILAALVEDNEGIVAPLLERVGLHASAVQAEAMREIEIRDVQVEIAADAESHHPIEARIIASDLGDLLSVHQEGDG